MTDKQSTKEKPKCDCGGELTHRNSGNQWGGWVVFYCKKCKEIIGHVGTVTGYKRGGRND